MKYNNNHNILHVSIGKKIEDWILNSEESLDLGCLDFLKDNRVRTETHVMLSPDYILFSAPIGFSFSPTISFTPQEQAYIEELGNEGLEFMLGSRGLNNE